MYDLTHALIGLHYYSNVSLNTVALQYIKINTNMRVYVHQHLLLVVHAVLMITNYNFFPNR